MDAVETYVKIRIADGAFQRFEQVMAAIAAALAGRTDALPRAECFAEEAKGEAIVIMVHRDAAAFQAITKLLAEPLSTLRGFCAIQVELLLASAAEANQFGRRTHRFAYGIEPEATPLLAPGTGERIEIFTQFSVKPGQLDSFKALAAEMTQTVKTQDPGTLRYDWYYEDASSHCFALDTYADPASMFAHMRNCHDLHEQLIARSTMVTEFLGTLPEAAAAAVARYDPYVLPLYRRLNQA